MTLFITALVIISETLAGVKSLFIQASFLSLLFFNVESVLLMYLAFELVLVPVMVLVLLWGRQPEKVSAVYFVVIYTGGCRFPFLFAIIQTEG
jgi:NADH:ubiquinone oxidoreductase subunit 4 (subunit M)